MKNTFINYFKAISKDRALFLLLIAILALTAIYVVSLLVNIRPSETQLYIRYTDFGQAHYYRGHWQYLYTFLVFGVLVVAAHIAMIIKFFTNERRQAAIGLAWLTIIMLAIIWSYVHSVLGIPH